MQKDKLPEQEETDKGSASQDQTYILLEMEKRLNQAKDELAMVKEQLQTFSN